MPVKQRDTFRDQAISAGFRKPISVLNRIRCKHGASFYQSLPINILLAAASVMIKVTASDLGVVHVTRVFIFEFMQATFSASVAKGLKFLLRHLFQVFC